MFKAFNKGELKYYDMFHEDKEYAKELSQLPLAGKDLVELGSGTGLMTKELRKRGFRVITVDPNAPADYSCWKEVDYTNIKHVLALYDVLNYFAPKEYKELKETVGDKLIEEIWDAEQGVKFFTYKKSDKAKRIRLGIKLFNRAYLTFIYWGKGKPAMAIHKLYLHNGY